MIYAELTNTISDDKAMVTSFLFGTEDRRVSDFFYDLLAEAYYLPYL